MLLLGALAVYLLVALMSYQAGDPGWSHTEGVGAVDNLGGVVGAWLADVFLYLFGYLAYLFPLAVAYASWRVLRAEGVPGGIKSWPARLGGFVLTLAAGCGLAALHSVEGATTLPLSAGGILGSVVRQGLVDSVSFLGAILLLLALFLAGVTLLTGLSWIGLTELIGRLLFRSLLRMRLVSGRVLDRWIGAAAKKRRDVLVKDERERSAKRVKPRIEPVLKAIETGPRVEEERQVRLFDPDPNTELPPLRLLDEPEAAPDGYSDAALEAMSRQVELKLRDFSIEARVVAVHPGPVITRFELEPGPGVKVAQISSLAKDLARALSTVSVRVVEIIPGKPVVGLEIPNEQRELVRLSEILRSKPYDVASSPLTLALGKDIGGHPIVVDLARMPHLLVAGTTGSGKSVAINAMVLSLLYKCTPADTRLIMIDPKMLELSVYEGIPHLLTPVVTDMKEAANALSWCVAEMERRYKLMSALGVRNIAGYNRKVKDAHDAGTPILDPLYKPDPLAEEPPPAPPLQALPFIVVFIDELADLMMVVGKKVEELIARLAQKARASGVHLILATQRPSVDVITGLIKANIPTRIAFQVSSKVDSRTILDQMGAEHLLGHGDMLYLAPGTGLPMRVHGAFVADQEVHDVVNFLKRAGKPDYHAEVLRGVAEGDDGLETYAGDDGESDALYDQAVRIVTETRRASISAVQRRLKVGYNRAARLMETMERAGVIGPLQPNGNRDVLAPPPLEP